MAKVKLGFNKNDGLKILKVLGYLIASTIITFLLDLIPSVDFGVYTPMVVPIINVILVAGKKYIIDNQPSV